jgi:quinol monooxygenase YgiN
MGLIIVTGSLTARAETYDEVLRLSREHVQRSRLEPGCLSHDVHVDVDDPHRLVFLERWADHDALLAHFAVAASQQFVRDVGPLVASPPTLELYQAEPLSV